ncbi:hypothetical protein [Pseudomonas sp. ACN5]|uniref:hypothetical protein n=1 Tax=Pseudomonas sp. ACN5 TaxID=1920427 RepID=UPI000BB30C5D|nr:hypothetical protein [Pseudomonas sp. ACN5]PBJ08460.1 hypothetical protein BSF40_13300 [Pseudomonas sp. ACN5]
MVLKQPCKLTGRESLYLKKAAAEPCHREIFIGLLLLLIVLFWLTSPVQSIATLTDSALDDRRAAIKPGT